MKICTVCNEKYYDDDLNYCLADGGLLKVASDDPPPTVMMNQARTTNQAWGNQTGWNTQQPQSPPPGPVSPWQNQQGVQNQGFMNPPVYRGQNQVLPIVSLALGIAGLLLFCCWGGLPFGLAALATGYLGMNNANKNPAEYGGKGLAIAGLILGVINIIGSLLLLLFAILGSFK